MWGNQKGHLRVMEEHCVTLDGSSGFSCPLSKRSAVDPAVPSGRPPEPTLPRPWVHSLRSVCDSGAMG